MQFTLPVDTQVNFLGVMYSSPNPKELPESSEIVMSEFLDDVHSRMWLTYRTGYDSFGPPKHLTTDAGWGCSIRVTQMLTAQCLLSLTGLGRDWRRDFSTVEQLDVYRDVARLFMDTTEAPLSIHKFMDVGGKMFGKQPGQWFGPTSGAKAMATLYTKNLPDEDVVIVNCDEPVIYRDEIMEKLRLNKKIILFLSMRLGVDSINLERYKLTIRTLFSVPFFQGLSSGETLTSAYYFIAACDDYLYYLDPHTVQPALLSVDGSALDDFLPPQERPYALRWSRLNPSMTVGFTFSNLEEFSLLVEILQKIDSNFFEILHTRGRAPEWDGLDEEEEDKETFKSNADEDDDLIFL